MDGAAFPRSIFPLDLTRISSISPSAFRRAARKTQGCYRELLPTLEYVKQEQKQEKPSIRDQLKAAAKQQPEKKLPVKSKTHDMEL